MAVKHSLTFLISSVIIVILRAGKMTKTAADDGTVEFAGKHQKQRQKRNAIQFGSMVTCTTGRAALVYNGYGCFCGLGGKGTPLDEIDQCCYEHDNCYNSLRTGGVCGLLQLYTDSYNYEQGNCSTDITTLNVSYVMGAPYILCQNSNLSDACKLGLCECDKGAAFCFASHRYDAELSGYDKRTCSDGVRKNTSELYTPTSSARDNQTVEYIGTGTRLSSSSSLIIQLLLILFLVSELIPYMNLLLDKL